MSDSRGTEGEAPIVRDVALLPGERVTHVFSPDRGLTGELPADGQVLITTNRRILAFCQGDGRNETFLVPVEEMKGVAVTSAGCTSGSLLQGLLIAAGGILLYLVVAYWLTGRFNGPNIPVINMDAGPFVVLVAGLVGAVFVGRSYFAREDGSVTFQGSNWSFVFPYRGDRAGQEIYQVVNTLFAAHNADGGRSALWKD